MRSGSRSGSVLVRATRDAAFLTQSAYERFTGACCWGGRICCFLAATGAVGRTGVLTGLGGGGARVGACAVEGGGGTVDAESTSMSLGPALSAVPWNGTEVACTATGGGGKRVPAIRRREEAPVALENGT